MLVTIQGFFEDGKFIPNEPVQIPNHQPALVTILGRAEDDRKKQQLAELDRLDKMLDESMDEEVPDFPRANIHREVTL